MTPTRFGTQAFYAALGRAFVAMCAVVPVLALIELARPAARRPARRCSPGSGPGDSSGLDGILLAPLVHDGWAHLVANSAPLILLGTFVLAAGTRRFLLATLFIALFSGLGVWILDAAELPRDRRQRRDLRLARPAADARHRRAAACGTSPSRWSSACSTAGSWSRCSPPTSGSPGRGTCSASSAAWSPRSCSAAGVAAAAHRPRRASAVDRRRRLARSGPTRGSAALAAGASHARTVRLGSRRNRS